MSGSFSRFCIYILNGGYFLSLDANADPRAVRLALSQGVKLKDYYPYFGVQPFTFPSKYFATLQKGRGIFL
jgi:hypothetical protein